MKLNCLVVDDEPLARDVLTAFIEENQELRLVHSCQNAIEAREILQHQEVDVVFLDIQMPEISGIEFLKSLRNPPMVVFTTAFPNYALEGFNLDAVDYLLKPFSKDRFNKAVSKLFERQRSKQNGNEETDLEHIFVKADQKLIKLRFEDIHYVEALADYVKIHTNERRIITLQTMKKMEEKLPQDRFIRVHRSFIVGVKKIKSINGNKIELGEQMIPIGKNYKNGLYEYLYSNNILN